MNLPALAADQLRRAGDRHRDAARAFEERRFPDALRYSQESLELALKAGLRALNVEAPKRHDVGVALDAVAEAVPAWFRREIPELKRLSSELAERRSLAMYGDERTGRPASELFDAPEVVRRFLEQVADALASIRRLLAPGAKPRGPRPARKNRRRK